MIRRGIAAIYYYVLGNIISLFAYDRKYLTGRWFHTRWFNIGADGWKWVVKDFTNCRKMGINQNVRWPVSALNTVRGNGHIIFEPDDLNNFQGSGCYFQCVADIIIGKGSYIASNVGIITANHSFDHLDEHCVAQNVVIGQKCWIGMNAVVLPGVELGDHTIVGAGAVVTKSFRSGNCLIAGNPARVIKEL